MSGEGDGGRGRRTAHEGEDVTIDLAPETEYIVCVEGDVGCAEDGRGSGVKLSGVH